MLWDCWWAKRTFLKAFYSNMHYLIQPDLHDYSSEIAKMTTHFIFWTVSVVAWTIAMVDLWRISSALLLSSKNILHKHLDPSAPDDAVYVAPNAAKRPQDWRISDWPHTLRRTQSISKARLSEGIEPSICAPEFQITTDRELLTVVSKAWSAISCATAGVSEKSNPLWTRVHWL